MHGFLRLPSWEHSTTAAVGHLCPLAASGATMHQRWAQASENFPVPGSQASPTQLPGGSDVQGRKSGHAQVMGKFIAEPAWRKESLGHTLSCALPTAKFPGWYIIESNSYQMDGEREPAWTVGTVGSEPPALEGCFQVMEG